MAKKQLKITLTFRDENKDVYDLLQSKPVIVDYVCEVVREKGKKDKDKIPEAIKRYIDSRIDEKINAVEIKPVPKRKNSLESIDPDVEAMILNEED